MPHRFTPLSALLLVALLAAPAAAQFDELPEIPIYLDDSPTAREQFAAAQRLVEQDRLTDAARVFQKVIDEFPYKLMEREEHLHTDALTLVRQTIARNEALLDIYRRQYEPTAKRALEQASADKGDLDQAALSDIVRRYGLCPSGLEAALRLAGAMLESADPSGAAAVLDSVEQHPDLATQMTRWRLLQAAAGLFGSDRARLELHTKALSERADGQAALSQLQSWQKRFSPAADVSVLDPLRTLPDATIPDLKEDPRWTIQTTASTAAADNGNGDVVIIGPGRAIAPETLQHPIIPVIDDDRLYLNDGSSITAIDRSSRYELWQFSAESPAAQTPAQARRFITQVRGGFDTRGVAVTPSLVIGVIGRTPNYQFGWAGPGGTTLLVALDRDNGSEVWRVAPTDIDKSLSNAFFHGTPIVDHDRVYALARRSQISSFQDSYVVCVRISDGKLLWKRYLSSSIAATMNVGGSGDDLTFDHGRIYVSNSLGAVASLSGQDGRLYWLRVVKDLPQKVNPVGVGAFRMQTAWQAGAPAHVAAGVILPPPQQESPAYLLDADTGKLLRSLEDPLWRKVDYLVPLGDDVVCVGEIVALVDGKTLEPKWQKNLTRDMGLRPDGRAAVTPKQIILPTSTRLLVLDTATGKPTSEFVMTKPGNVLLAEGQVVLASGSTVRSFMNWAQVQANLTRLIAKHPTDPTHGLALAEAAFDARQWDAGIQGVDFALDALGKLTATIDRGDPEQARAGEAAQERVFQTLLSFAESKRARDQRIRQLIFDRLARSTANPRHDVAYQLALGAFLVEIEEPERAADHFQAVLSDLELSNQLYERADGTRRAGLEARMRLAALIKANGARVYRKHEQMAADALVAQKLSARPDIAELEKLAEKYPLSRSAPAALVLAAETAEDTGQTDQAVGLLRQAYRMIGELQRIYEKDSQSAMAQRIIGMLAQDYTKLDQPWRARHWLRRLKREYEGVDPLRDGKPYAIDKWLAELNDQRSRPGTLPRLALPVGEVRVLPGTLMTPTRQAPATWPRDRFVTRTDVAIQLRAADNLRIRWQILIPNSAAELLSLSEEQMLVWFGKPGTLRAVDTDNGKTQWQLDEVTKLLGDVGRGEDDAEARLALARAALDEDPFNNPGFRRGLGAVRVNGRMPGVAADGDEPRILFEVSETVVCIADTRGRVIGIDRHSGQVLWRRLFPGQLLTHLHVGDEAVVVAGLSTVGGDDTRSLIMVLDPLTGEPVCPTIGSSEQVEWVGLSGDRLVVYATSSQVIGHHIVDGRDAWRIPVRAGNLTSVGWAEADLLVIRETGGRLMLIDPEAGQMIGSVDRTGDSADALLDIRVAEGAWHILSRDLATALAGDGQVLWRDAVDEKPKNLQVQLVGEQYVAVLSLSEDESRRSGTNLAEELGGNPALLPLLRGDPQFGGPRAWFYRLHLIDRQSGVIVEERVLGPMADVFNTAHATFVNNRLILSTTGATVVIPGADAPAAPTPAAP